MSGYRFFSDAELACKHCGEQRMDDDFMKRLDALREAMGKPVILTSAYRCPRHNDNVSSTGLDGPHTSGRAVDVRCYGHDAYYLVQAALDLGFTGIGLAQRGPHARRYVHLDDLNLFGVRPWIWTYA